MSTSYNPSATMRPLRFDDQWILKRLPPNLPEDVLCRALAEPYDLYIDDLTIIIADRGYRIVYEAKSKKDLLLWQFDHVCSSIAQDIEARYLRERNSSQFRYSQQGTDDKGWLFIERKTYVYNVIEDSRLTWFEIYLRLLKPVLSRRRWKEKVDYHIACMNRWFAEPHWDYDKKQLCFVEISDSEELTVEGKKEVTADRIVAVID